MSRNLGRRNCVFCGGVVKPTGPVVRTASLDQSLLPHNFPEELRGLIYRSAWCIVCQAPYAAWLCGLDRLRCRGSSTYPTSERDSKGELKIQDLSHAISWNDYPDYDDNPRQDLGLHLINGGDILQHIVATEGRIVFIMGTKLLELSLMGNTSRLENILISTRTKKSSFVALNTRVEAVGYGERIEIGIYGSNGEGIVLFANRKPAGYRRVQIRMIIDWPNQKAHSDCAKYPELGIECGCLGEVLF